MDRRALQNQRRHGDPIDNPGARRAIVVVVGVAKTAIAGHDFVVKLAKRAYRAQSRQLINAREEGLPCADNAVTDRAENATRTGD